MNATVPEGAMTTVAPFTARSCSAADVSVWLNSTTPEEGGGVA